MAPDQPIIVLRLHLVTLDRKVRAASWYAAASSAMSLPFGAVLGRAKSAASRHFSASAEGISSLPMKNRTKQTIPNYRASEPYGKCVYCGVIGMPLTDEHIVPQALGERYFIPNACCDTCQKIIHAFETNSLNSIILMPLKKMLGLRSKRRKSNPNQTFRLYCRNDNDSQTAIDIPLADLMLSALVPEFPLPGMLQKTARISSYVHETVTIHVFGEKRHWRTN